MNWFIKLFKGDGIPFIMCPRHRDWIKIDGKWHHYVITSKGTYFDGVKVGK